MSSKNHEENCYNLDLELLIISHKSHLHYPTTRMGAELKVFVLESLTVRELNLIIACLHSTLYIT